jgi:hypothetical protein
MELGSPNYFKVESKMRDLEENKFDVHGAIGKGPNYRYFWDTKFLPILKEIFDNPP